MLSLSPIFYLAQTTQISPTHPPGFYTSNISLTLETNSEDTIYYSLDGSVPTKESFLFMPGDSIVFQDKSQEPNYYSEFVTTVDISVYGYPIWESPEGLLSKGNILRFCSYKNGEISSSVQSGTYFIFSDGAQKYELPVISLMVDEADFFSQDSGIYTPGLSFDEEIPESTGNYYKRGDAWERNVHIEYYNEAGQLGFSQDAGVRIHGGATRTASQKSLKFYARSEYGDSQFHYKLLPNNENDEYKRFLLQSSMGDWGKTIIKDPLAHEICRSLNFATQDSRPVIVFLNGEYWGVQTIRDRIDKYYLEYKEGATHQDSVTLLNSFNNPEAIEGDAEGFIELLEFINENDIAFEENYNYLLSQIDIENYIDYNIAEIFLSNYDWPGNNVKYWRESDGSTKWRWIFFDIDGGLYNYRYDMLEHCTLNDDEVVWPNSPPSTFIFRNLLRNDRFVSEFILRYAEILRSNFSLNTTINKASSLVDLYSSSISEHSDRWNFPENENAWRNDINEHLLEFLEKRHCYAVENLSNFFDLSDFPFDCCSEATFNTLLAYPNPSRGDFSLLNISEESMFGTVTISTTSGSRVYSEAGVTIRGGQTLELSNLDLPKGIYIVTFQGSLKGQSLKLIVF
ncbi:MAG: T9SS type A sorting domain-containing protein [Flavobacteriales bacterium]|nr:T9SS type A sorting domain-containing protein [Flavobacteriales bacterium]